MRVLQAMGAGGPGGAERMFSRLCAGLARRGLAQRVVVRHGAHCRDDLRRGGIEPVELAFGGLLDFATRRRIGREIAAFRPDVVLTWMNRATRFCPPPSPPRRRRRFVHVARLGGYYDMKYYRRCDHLVGNTEDLRDYFIRHGWPAERAHYLPNFVDDAAAPPVPRRDLDTPADAPLLLALGRLHGNKAFDVLIEALPSLPGAWLWLAGTGPEAGNLKARAARLGVRDRVRFLGWRDDTAALLAAADLLVVPSRHEPLGNVVLEGFAHGVPVVAAAAAGPASLIRDDANGLLVPVDDSDALAAALGRLIGDPHLRSDLAASARADFRAAFTEDAVCARYLEFFDAVAGR